MLLAFGQLVVQHTPKVVLCKAAFQTLRLQHVLVLGVIPLQMQDFTPCIVEVNYIPLCLSRSC